MAYPTNIINTASTDLSTFKILVNEVPLDPTYGVAGITVNNQFNKIPTAQLIIRDGDTTAKNVMKKFEASASDLFIPGAEIKIMMGYHNKNLPVFKGIVVSHSIQVRTGRPTCLVVELKDEAVKLTVGRKNKCFFNKTDRDIIKSIVSEQGLSFGLPIISVTGNPVDPIVAAAAAQAAAQEAIDIASELPNPHKEMVQYYCTDWDFIVTRAEAIGKLIYVEDGRISLIHPSSVGAPMLNLTYGINIYEFDATMDARDDYKKVVARSWDDAQGDFTESSSSSASEIAEEGNITADTLAGDVVDLDQFLLQHPGNLKKSEIENWAKAKMMRSRLSKIQGRVKIEGFAGIKPGYIININQFSPRFNDHAYVTAVTHILTSDSAWYTDIQFGFSQEWFATKYKDITDEPASGLLPAVNGLMIGKVKKVVEQTETGTDYRVQVVLQMFNKNSGDSDAIWARYSAPYAGNGWGVFFRPEVDDEVVVGFLNDDPREPIILGSLHNKCLSAPPVEPKESNYIKGIYTQGKLEVKFDDENKVITIVTPNKNTITISDKDDFISLKDKKESEIKIDKDGITLTSKDKITLKAEKDIILDTKGKITKSATKDITMTSKSGKVDVKASTVLTLKGTTKVDINPPG
ncbi:MAG TPA: type VI secretion system tip protein VgrG [Flavobacteriales bacterium]|nr:type VI secretion system tip protein VgrG [Flavobacteriales bacterium]